MQLLISIGAGLVGAVLGSFANVPIHRWPRQGTVAEPRRSACPSCGSTVAARDNVPIVSWLLLRGRCRTCGAPISVRYLVVEVTTTLLFAAVAWVHHDQPLLLVTLLALTWSLVVATVIDLEWRIIPNRLTYPLPLVLAVPLVAHAVVSDTLGDLRRGAIAALALPAGMFLLSELFRLVRGQVGMGMGDVKLAASLGLVVGYLGALQLVAFFYATIGTAVVVALALVLAGRARLASRIPFGPYLAAGTLLTVLAPTASGDLVARVLGL